MDLFPESFREPGILILRPTPVEDTGRNPALCENRFPVYQHDNLLEASFDDQAVRTVDNLEAVIARCLKRRGQVDVEPAAVMADG